MKNGRKLDELQSVIKRYSNNTLTVIAEIPPEMEHLMSKSLRNYLKLPLGVQLAVRNSYSIRGTLGKKGFVEKGKKKIGFVFQMSGGTQQIKEYDREIYKNDRNSPLRVRSRTIMHLAMQEPLPGLQQRIKNLYSYYPYYLVKDEAVNLRMKNFYFENQPYRGNIFRIYRALNPGDSDPQSDEFYLQEEFLPKKQILPL